jgi:hypothetical protein
MPGHEAALSKARTISRGGFLASVVALGIVFFIAELLAVAALAWALGTSWLIGGWVGGLACPNALLAHRAVDRILIRLGRSRSGKVVEVRARATAGPEVAISSEAVAVPHSRPLIGMMVAACLSLALAALLFLGLAPRPRPWEAGFAHAVAVIAAVGALYYWWDGSMPQAEANSDGITGYPNGYHVRRRFVPWSDVATCEIATEYDTFGRPIRIRPTLMGDDDTILMTLHFQHASREEQEHLVEFIKSRLPKTRWDGWD